MKSNTAYNTALAGESVPDQLKEKYDEDKDMYYCVTHNDLERFARIVAYKTAHNLKNGYTMDENGDPLTYIDCGGEK